MRTLRQVDTVLVIAHSHALGLAVPLVVATSTTIGAPSGLLVRHRQGLEQARTVIVVMFEKTGTLSHARGMGIDTVTAQALPESKVVGALLVSISTLMVAIIAQLLRRARL